MNNSSKYKFIVIFILTYSTFLCNVFTDIKEVNEVFV